MNHADAVAHVAERYLDIEPNDVPAKQRDEHIAALVGILRLAGGNDYINGKWSRTTAIRHLREKAENAIDRMLSDAEAKKHDGE